MFIERPQIFDRHLDRSLHSPQLIRRLFDGTVFNGLNGVQVNFNDSGEVVNLLSFYLHSATDAPPFRRNFSDTGWLGEGGYYGDNTVLGIRLRDVVSVAQQDWNMWKETEAEHPGISFREWKYQRALAFEQEYRRLQQETNNPANQ